MIKEVIRAMLEQGYLRQTQDKYSLLKLTEKSGQLLDEGTPFIIRYKKEEEKKGPGLSGAGKRSAQTEELTEKGRELFEELRRFRMELARKRSVPPYVVASDKTLRDMCVKLPLNEGEMLDVHGMGAKKLEQYGGLFLEKIRSVTGGDRETWGTVRESDNSIENEDSVNGSGETPLTEKKIKGRKSPFCLTEEILAGIRYVPETTISDFVAQINELRDEKLMKRLTIKQLTESLLEEGCLEQKFQNGYTRKFLTEKGREAGIRAEERISSNGNPYEVFLYTEEGQKYLVGLMKRMSGTDVKTCQL